MQHLDEGTIHAWLDEALSSEESARVEQHINDCRQCSAAVAEARGLIAASSRILGKLDHVPGGVTTQSKETRVPTSVPPSVRAKPASRWLRPRYAAAAALAIVAVGTWASLRQTPERPFLDVRSDSAQITADQPPAAVANAAPSDTLARDASGDEARQARIRDSRAAARGSAPPSVPPSPVATGSTAGQASAPPSAREAEAKKSAERTAPGADRQSEAAFRLDSLRSPRRSRNEMASAGAAAANFRPLSAVATEAVIDSMVTLFSGCYNAARGPRALDDGFPPDINLLTRKHRRMGDMQTWIAAPGTTVPADVTWEWSMGAAFNVVLQRAAGGPLLNAEFFSGSGADVVLRRVDCR